MAKKILIVDDDIDLVDIYKPVLEKNDYIVSAAHNSVEGLEAYKSFQPDVVIVDLSMETFDSGFVLCQKIKREQSDDNQVPVIILTSAGKDTGIRFSTETDEEKNWIKADDYLEKPISPKDLLIYLNEKIFKN